MTNRHARTAILLTSLAAALLAGCAGDPTAPAPGARVVSVAVAPADLALDVGAAFTLTARALDGAGAAVPSQPIAWTSTDTAVATVSAAGVVQARRVGRATIRATSAGRAGAVDVTVHERTVAWIEITPSGASLPQAVGTSRQLGVVARAADGTEVVGRPVAWASSDAAVASVSAGGLLQAHAAGTAWIVAAVDGRRDSTLVTVPTLVTRIDVDAAELALGIGQTRVLAATARDAHGAPLSRPFGWSSSNAAVAAVDASGRVTATGAGSALVTVTTEGRSATVRVTVTGQQWRLADVAGAPLPEVLFTGTTAGPDGVVRAARFRVSDGILRLREGRYELRLQGWVVAEGVEPVQATVASDGFVAYDVFTGAPLLHEREDWGNQAPRFRTRFRDDGTLELDWSREPGGVVVRLGFVTPG